MFRNIITFATAAAAAAALMAVPGSVAHADEPVEPAPRATFTTDAPEPVSTMIPGSYMFHVIERYCLDLSRADACQ